MCTEAFVIFPYRCHFLYLCCQHFVWSVTAQVVAAPGTFCWWNGSRNLLRVRQVCTNHVLSSWMILSQDLQEDLQQLQVALKTWTISPACRVSFYLPSKFIHWSVGLNSVLAESQSISKSSCKEPKNKATDSEQHADGPHETVPNRAFATYAWNPKRHTALN